LEFDYLCPINFKFMKTIRVLLVDDHNLMLDGLSAMLVTKEGIQVVGRAEDGRKALDLVKIMEPHVVMMDMDMPVLNGLEASKIVLRQYPSVRVIMLTMHHEPGLVKKVKEYGLHGFLMKTTDGTEMVLAIRTVAAGGTAFPTEEVIHNMANSRSGNLDDQQLLSELTEREIEILKCIAKGMSNKEIGEQLHISHRTVDTHRTNLARKLSVKNIAGLVHFAFRNGLLLK